MMMFNWAAFKNFVQSQSLSIQYTSDDNFYYLWLEAHPLRCDLQIGSVDATDFETNFKTAGNQKKVQPTTVTDGAGNTVNQLDIDNALIVRPKAAKKGWSFWAIPVELTTSTLGGTLYCKNSLGTDISGLTCKIYDGNNAEITTAGLLNANLATCVKTVVDFEPGFDYEIIGGALRINSDPSQDIRLWIVGAPDIPVNLGGSKEFASGINLKFLSSDSTFDIDGRVTKYIVNDPVYHSGKLRIILKHPAGATVNLQFVIHIYRL